MLDKKQFDEQMRQEREAQIRDLTVYFEKYAQINAHIRDYPISVKEREEDLKKIADIPIPREGRDPREVGRELVEDILQKGVLLQHPRYLSLVASAVSPYAIAAAVMTDIFNPNLAGWSLNPEAAMVEEKLVRWMGGLAGFPEDKCGGIFTSGGSLSNLTGFIAGRTAKLSEEEYPIGVAYISDQTHSSAAKGLRLMGLRKDQIRKIPTDDDFRMRIDLLLEAIEQDLRDGKKPFLLVGNLGSTNTGSIDPLSEMGDICKKYGMWFHVDGAYGGSILFSNIYNNLAKGIEKADTLAWDTHKWSLQPYSSSCIIAKDKQNLITAFNEHPEYLDDVRSAEHNDGWDLGIEMSRPARAMKLWYTVQAIGTDKLADVIDYAFFNAKTAEKKLLSFTGWEIVSKPMCGAITFRYAPEGYPKDKLDDLNAAISKEIIDSGFAYIVTTVVKEKRVLRLCIINGNTTTDDVVETMDKLDEIAKKLTR